MSMLASCIILYIPAVLKNAIVDTLAHEARHAWQNNSGEWRNHFEQTSYLMHMLMPYDYRWEERDANEFSYRYRKGMNK
jgi:hypothetical protein